MRLLYIMICVMNLDVFLVFYIEVLGMKLLCKKDYFDGKFMLVFVGFGVELE